MRARRACGRTTAVRAPLLVRPASHTVVGQRSRWRAAAASQSGGGGSTPLLPPPPLASSRPMLPWLPHGRPAPQGWAAPTTTTTAPAGGGNCCAACRMAQGKLPSTRVVLPTYLGTCGCPTWRAPHCLLRASTAVCVHARMCGWTRVCTFTARCPRTHTAHTSYVHLLNIIRNAECVGGQDAARCEAKPGFRAACAPAVRAPQPCTHKSRSSLFACSTAAGAAAAITPAVRPQPCGACCRWPLLPLPLPWGRPAGPPARRRPPRTPF